MAKNLFLCETTLRHSSLLCVFPQPFVRTYIQSLANLSCTSACSNSRPANKFRYAHISYLFELFEKLPCHRCCWYWASTSVAVITSGCLNRCFELTLHQKHIHYTLNAMVFTATSAYCVYCFHKNVPKHLIRDVINFHNTGWLWIKFIL
jgi:hypothetical protein